MSWLLTLQDGKGGFEFVGTGFQVKDKDARKVMRNASSFNPPKFDSLLSVFAFQDIQNIDDLKKVQTSSEILFVSCSGNIFQKRRDRLSRANIFAICAVSSWFAFMSKTAP